MENNQIVGLSLILIPVLFALFTGSCPEGATCQPNYLLWAIGAVIFMLGLYTYMTAKGQETTPHTPRVAG